MRDYKLAPSILSADFARLVASSRTRDDNYDFNRLPGYNLIFSMLST